MTRATLLQLLAHPAALNGADVRALEQLADAFPYCQTAHLLLAKAAHDQGSMLAGQRLRRAATYAADRTHLRQLIELPVLAATPTVLVAAEANGMAPAALPGPDFAADEVPSTAPTNTVGVEQQEVTSFNDLPDQVIGQAEPTAVTPAAEAEPVEATKLLKPVSSSELELATAAELSELPPLAEAVLPIAAELPETAPPAAEIVTVKAPEKELPVQAPPIRPPAGAEAARFEFGLAEQEPAEITAYRLPELLELVAPPNENSKPSTPRLPVFRGLTEVNYVPEEGSRLGFCLVAASATGPLPGTMLPPAGEFFEPDALLLAHLATHQQPATPKASSLKLIDSFLQRAPTTTRRRTLPSPATAEPEAQADLSVRSTRAESDLASESLAKILVRQGKTDRAIAVYELLMVKYPERKAHFATQIESLRPLA